MRGFHLTLFRYIFLFLFYCDRSLLAVGWFESIISTFARASKNSAKDRLEVELLLLDRFVLIDDRSLEQTKFQLFINVTSQNAGT